MLNENSFVVKMVLFLLLAALTAWRQPELLTTPRLIAEEGTYYFSYAYQHSPLQNLLHPQFGYYTLYHSIVTSLASLLPLESAPLVTMWGAFLVQLTVGYLVLWGDIPFLDKPWKRPCLVLLIPLLCYYSSSWLSTIGVQYWLCILSFLILNEAPADGSKTGTLLRGLFLTFAGLTGVTSCFLTPAFAHKALRTRSRQFVIYAVTLAVCSLIQVGVFVYAFLNRDPGLGMRFVKNDPVFLLTKILVFQFAEPFVGQWIFHIPAIAEAGDALNAQVAAIFGGTIFRSSGDILGDLVGAAILFFVGYLAMRKARDPNYLYLIESFFVVVLLSSLLSLNMSAGPRYAFAPGVMLIFFACSIWDDPELRISRYVIRCLILLSVIAHAVAYRPTMNLSYDNSWPRWRDEVQQWRQDPSHRLKIWPPGWEVSLETPSAKAERR